MDKDKPSFEMADVNKPEDVVAAYHRALTQFMRTTLADIKKEVGGIGLRWEQIEFFIEGIANKKPQIFYQTDEQ